VSADPALDGVRSRLRRLELPIVHALVARARYRSNAAALAGAVAGFADARIGGAYTSEIVPFLCAPGDDGRGQESAALDERLGDLLDARLRLGVDVADAKARQEPERISALVAAADREGLLRALTDERVERHVLERVRALAEAIGAPPPPPATVAEVFARWVIPLTKEIEVEHLLRGPRD
jgi:chorismate mutase